MASIINCESNVRHQNMIDEYPEEMLLKIFSFLDTMSIRNLTLVNERWYDVVINNISTMKNCPLIISDDKLIKNHLIVGHWKFYKVIFKSLRKSFNTEMLSCLGTIGSNIREIEFINCYVSEPEEFQIILRNFPKVEKMLFESCSCRNQYQKSDTKVLELENLIELVLDVKIWNQ